MESPNSLDERLDQLAADRQSGALGLALAAVEISLDWISLRLAPEILADRLESMHPGIAPLANLGRILRENPGRLPSQLRSLRESLQAGNRRIAEKLQRIIPAGSKIVTISNSSTVREGLRRLRPRQVYVLESRPGGEGIAMAESLREILPGRVVVELLPDASVALAVGGADCALVGIDTLDAAGGIIHKVGTLPLALCCRFSEKLFYAGGHSLKRLPEAVEWAPTQPLGETLFDYTPPELITSVITEE